MATFDDPEVERIYTSGLKHIENVRQLNTWDEHGILVLPFTCYICVEKRDDLFMMTGDNLPICRKCFSYTVD